MATGFFEETPGVKSLMRLMSFLMLLFFFIMNSMILAVHIKALAHGCELPQISENFLWFDSICLVAAFCPKVLQKLIEAKFGIKDDSTTDKTVIDGK